MIKIMEYFSPVCPHCPGAKRLVADVVSRYEGRVEVEEVDAFTPEGIKRGMANDVIAVPTVFVDEEKKFVGFPFAEEDLVTSIEEAIKG